MEMQDAPRVAVIMGSKSDWATMQRAAELLAELGVPYKQRLSRRTGLRTSSSTTSGYDGKGQARVGCVDELEDAWRALGQPPALDESFVDFEKEISVLLARDLDGNVRFYPSRRARTGATFSTPVACRHEYRQSSCGRRRSSAPVLRPRSDTSE